VMLYTLAPSDTESEAGLVIANTTAVLGKLRLTALNEELKQTKLRVSVLNAVQSSVVSMSLYDGATLVAGPVPLTGQNADFSSFNFVVPKDGSKTLTVKAVLNSISGGATSGADLSVEFDTGSDDGQSNFEYRGTSSSTVVTTQAGADVAGAQKVLRKTKPTVSLAALPTTTLSNGTMVLHRVTVTADSAEQVSLKTIKWTVSKSANAITITGNQSSVREVGQGSTISGSSTGSTGCGASAGPCVLTTTFGSEQVIAAGTSKTYELVVTVGGALTTNTLSTSIAVDSGVVTDDLAAAGSQVNTTAYNFIWSDNSAIPHTDTDGGSDDWTNGLYVKVLPTDSQTVLFP